MSRLKNVCLSCFAVTVNWLIAQRWVCKAISRNCSASDPGIASTCLLGSSSRSSRLQTCCSAQSSLDGKCKTRAPRGCLKVRLLHVLFGCTYTRVCQFAVMFVCLLVSCLSPAPVGFSTLACKQLVFDTVGGFVFWGCVSVEEGDMYLTLFFLKTTPSTRERETRCDEYFSSVVR